MRSRPLQALAILSCLGAVLLFGGCSDPSDEGVFVIECFGDCVLHTGGLSQATTDGDGVAVVASERLGVAYELTARDEDGAVIPGLQVRYQETESGASLIVIGDPDGRYGSLVVLGSPEYIRSALAPQTSALGLGVRPTFDDLGRVERQLIGVAAFTVVVVGVTLTALVATKHSGSLFEAAHEATVFFEDGVLRDNALEMCRTPAEIATLWRNQADIQEALDGIMFSLLLMPASMVPLAKELVILIEAATLVQPDTSSVQTGEEVLRALNAETGADLTMSSQLHVRISDLDSYGTSHAMLLAPLEIVSLECDPADFAVGGYTLTITHAPQLPAAFEGVTVRGRLTPPDVGRMVEFDARGTDEYRQLDVAYTDTAGEVSFFVPGGATGVRDEYVMYVPSLGLSAYDVLVFGASSSAGVAAASVADKAPTAEDGARWPQLNAPRPARP